MAEVTFDPGATIADIDAACELVRVSGDEWTGLSMVTRTQLECAGWTYRGGVYHRGPHLLTMVRTRLTLRLA